MIKIIFLLLIPIITFGQTIGGAGVFRAGDADLVKTYTNYAGTNDNTTDWLTISDPVIGSRPLLATRLVAFAICTDSVHADIYFIGRNNTQTTFTTNTLSAGTSSTTYTDSIPLPGNKDYTASLPQIRAIQLVGDGVNRMPGCTQFKIRTLFKNVAQQGKTPGRTLKWHIQWVR